MKLWRQRGCDEPRALQHGPLPFPEGFESVFRPVFSMKRVRVSDFGTKVCGLVNFLQGPVATNFDRNCLCRCPCSIKSGKGRPSGKGKGLYNYIWFQPSRLKRLRFSLCKESCQERVDSIWLTQGAVIIYGWGGRCKSENRAHSKFAPLDNRALKICPPPSKAMH